MVLGWEDYAGFHDSSFLPVSQWRDLLERKWDFIGMEGVEFFEYEPEESEAFFCRKDRLADIMAILDDDDDDDE